MINGKCDGMRKWILGAVATGIMIPSMPVFGQTKTSMWVNPKKARKSIPVQTTEPPQLLAVPDGVDSKDGLAQSPSQIVPTAGEKSEVQKQLEALYEQDGRDVPTFNLQPLSPINGQPQKNAPTQQPTAPANNQTRPGQPAAGSASKPARPAQGYTQYQPRTQATPYSLQPANGQPRNFSAAIDAQTKPQFQAQNPPQYLPQYQQQSKNPINNLFRRITGQNKYVASQTPLPPDHHDLMGPPQNSGVPAVPAVPIAAQYTTQPRSAGQPNRPTNQPILATLPAPIQPTNPVQITAGTSTIPAELPPPLIAMPALSDSPVPINGSPEQTSLPPLMTEPQGATLALKSKPEPTTSNPPAAEVAADFPNPFTEMTESEADTKGRKPQKSADVALEAPDSGSETKDDESKAESDAAEAHGDDPFAGKPKDFSEPSLDEKLAPGAVTVAPPASPMEPPSASPTMPEISMPPAFDLPVNDNANPPSELTPPASPPSAGPEAIKPPEVTVDPQVEKMKRIRERFGMKGLKGFCPVTLHDERELVDARPDFHFTHRSQKFHFATAEARDKFAANPSKYAPAAYGADVVALSRDKDVVEGTLDFAAWFKGRLYLFGTQANYDVFITAPAKYATLVEIE